MLIECHYSCQDC